MLMPDVSRTGMLMLSDDMQTHIQVQNGIPFELTDGIAYTNQITETTTFIPSTSTSTGTIVIYPGTGSTTTELKWTLRPASSNYRIDYIDFGQAFGQKEEITNSVEKALKEKLKGIYNDT